MHTKLLLALSLLVSFTLSACGSNEDLPVRTTPQLEHPVTGKISTGET
ncbi:hypothetical protein [Shimia haliotis]|uniref:Uncharacterized protein n=1 Tax=Shimia haliotis TaxID=1280847 RepID=A0A1I4CUH0_9RHOB|nr:hypothetical protein [Shimia haliotis]SFK83561.1 hypothetical protein SAMN04488036_102444 [Shimia haliotis]